LQSNIDVAGRTKDAFVDVEVSRVEFSADTGDCESKSVLSFKNVKDNLVRSNITKCESILVDLSLVKGEVRDWSFPDLLQK
jgi:hypothetical protein